jgi:hypothetical protein
LLFLLLISIVHPSTSRHGLKNISEWLVILPIIASIVLVAFILRESTFKEVGKGIIIANKTMRVIIFSERISQMFTQFKVKSKA